MEFDELHAEVESLLQLIHEFKLDQFIVMSKLFAEFNILDHGVDSLPHQVKTVLYSLHDSGGTRVSMD